MAIVELDDDDGARSDVITGGTCLIAVTGVLEEEPTDS